MEVEQECEDDMEAAWITCHSNKVRKWIFINTNYCINKELMKYGKHNWKTDEYDWLYYMGDKAQNRRFLYI